MWSMLEKKDFNNVMQYLQKHSPNTCPMYGNISSAGFIYKLTAMRSGVFYISTTETNEISGIIAGFNDGNIMVHSSDKSVQEGMLEIISALPFHSIWGLDGTLPDRDVLSKKANMKMDERILDIMTATLRYDNQLSRDMELIRIDKHFLTPNHISFIKKCLWEGFGFKSGSWDIRKRMKERTALEPYWFLKHNGVFVAQAHVQAMTKKHGYIGGVCTLRKFKRSGYARKIMEMVCENIYQAGRTPSLAVSSVNKSAYNLYKNMGFIKIGTIIVYMKERKFKGDENQ